MSPLIFVPANDIDASGVSMEVELPESWLNAQVGDADAHAEVEEEASGELRTTRQSQRLSEVRAEAPGRFRGRLSRSGRADIVVRGTVDAVLVMPCARCLAPTKQVVRTDLTLLLLPRPNIGHGHGTTSERKSSRGTRGPSATRSDAVSRRSDVDAIHGKAARTPAATLAATPPRSKANQEYEFSSEEADHDEYDGERVVLDDFVREAILLELPSFPLCSESCAGMGLVSISSDGVQRRASSGSAHAASPTEPSHPHPFEALRRFLPAGAVDSADPSTDSEGPRRPTVADVRRVSKARSRSKPMIRSSMASRTKK